MYVQTTGPGGVAEVVELLRFTKYRRPRHFVQMVFQCHRMRYELQAFIQAAVRLDVQVFGVGVRDVKKLLRIAVNRTAVIDFKLNAEMPQALAMEHEVGRVAIFVNDIVMFVPARRAVSVIVAVPVRAIA